LDIFNENQSQILTHLMTQPVNLVELASRYWESAALNAAVSLGIFEALASGKQTAAALAALLDCAPEHLEALLDSLCGLQILGKYDTAYAIREELIFLLDPKSPDCLLSALRFNADLMGLWLRLPDCVKTGKPVLTGNPHLGEDPERMRRFVEGMHSRAGIMARGVIPCLRVRPGSRILDVGGGPGTFSLKLLERDETLSATVLDLPPVVAAAADIHQGHPALDRLRFLGGDYHCTPFPEAQDLILYSGALHQEAEDGIPELFRRMRGALAPDGLLCVVDLMLAPDRTTPVYSALFQLNMMLMRPRSRTYSTDRLAEILEGAGFDPQPPESVPGTPYTLVRALPA